MVVPVEKHKKYALLDTDFLYKTHLARNQKLMMQAASEFGLTPSARSRIVAGNTKTKESEDEMEALLGGDS